MTQSTIPKMHGIYTLENPQIAPFTSYLSPVFNDNNRLEKVKLLAPQIDAIYENYAKEHHFPGYVYGIVLDGKLIHVGCGGVTDHDRQVPVTAHSMFRIASMTKSFIAMAILKLRDEGKLRLDDPVKLYIPELHLNQLTQDNVQFTIRELLIHLSGLPFDDPWADQQLDMSNPEFKTFLEKGLTFSNPIGISYEYSSLNYTLLGEVIRRISGISYEQYIADHLWLPLRMEEVSWEFSEVPALHLVHGYRWNKGNWTEENLLSQGAFGAMGGIIASIHSFSQYMALHQFAWPPREEAEMGPIKRSSIREMHLPSSFIDLIPDFKYFDNRTTVHTQSAGYGLRWIRDSQGRTYVGHSGGLPGFGSNWYIMPEYGLGVVCFANVTYAPVSKLNLQVLDKLVVDAQLSPRQLPCSKILKERQDDLLKVLPNWEHATPSALFAKNFFLDYSIDELKKETTELFEKAGNIISVENVVSQTQLKGYFDIHCEVMNIRVTFSLTPESPPLIQQFQIMLTS